MYRRVLTRVAPGLLFSVVIARKSPELKTFSGRYLAVVWEMVDEDPLCVYPVTAYPAPEPGERR